MCFWRAALFWCFISDFKQANFTLTSTFLDPDKEDRNEGFDSNIALKWCTADEDKIKWKTNTKDKWWSLVFSKFGFPIVFALIFVTLNIPSNMIARRFKPSLFIHQECSEFCYSWAKHLKLLLLSIFYLEEHFSFNDSQGFPLSSSSGAAGSFAETSRYTDETLFACFT